MPQIFLYSSSTFSSSFTIWVCESIQSLIMPPYSAPALNPRNGASNQAVNHHPCSERQALIRAGLAPRYTNPCSSINNIEPNTPAQRFHTFTHRACAVFHPPGHTVCQYCIRYIESQRWWKLKKTYLQKPPPLMEQPTLYSPGRKSNLYFSTRLCSLCEDRELYLHAVRSGFLGPGMVPMGQIPANMPNMPLFPNSTCTCISLLVNNVKCETHRKEGWEAASRNQLRAQVATNKAWLEGIEHCVMPGTFATQPPTAQRRITQQLWRACRCGADPIAIPKQARVLQCLACEGIHVRQGIVGGLPGLFGWAAGLPPGFTVTVQTRQNSRNSPALFRFHRPVRP